MEDFPEIRTENYRLRKIDENDLENIFAGLSNPEVIKYYDISFSSLEETKLQMSWFEDLEKTKTGLWWAITNSQDLFFGAVGFNNRNADFQKADLGFWLLPEFWSRGIMSEIILHVCHFGFEKFGLNRIEAQVESENSSSKKLMRKLNFTHEGTLRQYEIKDGKYIDLEIYSKLKSD